MASIVCIGIIGRSVRPHQTTYTSHPTQTSHTASLANHLIQQNQPLHITILPPHESSHFKFSLLLNSCLDIIELRTQHVSVDQDLGLLHVLDERFAAYGWITNTGVKFVVIVDVVGNVGAGSEGGGAGLGMGMGQGDLKPVRISSVFPSGVS